MAAIWQERLDRLKRVIEDDVARSDFIVQLLATRNIPARVVHETRSSSKTSAPTTASS